MEHPDRQAAIIENDLDSMIHRIEMLPAHPCYTNALLAVTKARDEVISGRAEIHHSDMKKRFGG